MKIGDKVRVVPSHPEDTTFDMRFADKVGIIAEERGEGDITFSVEFNPQDFDPSTPVPDNCIEDEDHWRDRLNTGLFESLWAEELIPIVYTKDGDEVNDDEQAWEFVYNQYLTGCKIAQRALTFLAKNCEQEFKRIKQHCESLKQKVE